MIQKIRDAFAIWFKEKTGIAVLYDPQPVTSAEPAIRMVFTGASEQGASRDVLTFQFTIVGSGDGPDFFLASIIEVSLKVQDVMNDGLEGGRRYFDIDVPGRTEKVRVTFTGISDSTGSFTQNEFEETETRQWRYTYVEPHVVRFDFPRSLRREV
ncbi:hypothetical protein [Parasphaerochaeta coccoides]|uniref:Uncharacterized protein n=1 Tax=Parasphaerochaeta coccoides (strain ATCC BAA-1237 / DSM 17374 / SPN1) TaxID=760011 RepID=F4GHD6_PARC1|nr:hypothetical protein [Parasphaerochaeta coccoides]AEC02035.1 hypothetical protein Spico_0810 [Parasphaerochaeta coccoides DSM 17374]